MPVHVPGALVRDHNLTATARLLWIHVALAQPGSDLVALEDRSCFDRRTVLTGIHALQQAGWLTMTAGSFRVAGAGGPERTAFMPAGLLRAKGLSHHAKLLYTWLQLTPGFQDTAGEITYQSLSEAAGVSAKTAKHAAESLANAGWLSLTQLHKFAPIQFQLKNPITGDRKAALALAIRRLERSKYDGEAIMQELLTALVASNEFDDNVTPGYLINPYTGEELQLDRLYDKLGVAFEFQGPQHFGATTKFPNETEALKQQARDHIKEGMCRRHGIRLITVVAEELTAEAITAKVRDVLALRELEEDDPVLAHLKKVSEIYQLRIWLARAKEKR